jgi:dolichol-phosphate mannosyltransferase
MGNNQSPPRDWIASGIPDLFSILIPARDEAKNLQVVVPTLVSELARAGIKYEILVVNDGSTDDTREVLVELAACYTTLNFVDNPPPHGFGLAVRTGLPKFRGPAVAIVMADGSDDPADILGYFAKLNEGYD